MVTGLLTCGGAFGCGDSQDDYARAVKQAQAVRGYQVYFAGREVSPTLPFSGSDGTGTFYYGECDPGKDTGCLPPVEIHNERGCIQRAPLPQSGSKRVTIKVRGVRAKAIFEGSFERLELQLGGTAVSISAFDLRSALTAARQLRSVEAHAPGDGLRRAARHC